MLKNSLICHGTSLVLFINRWMKSGKTFSTNDEGCRLYRWCWFNGRHFFRFRFRFAVGITRSATHWEHVMFTRRRGHLRWSLSSGWHHCCCSVHSCWFRGWNRCSSYSLVFSHRYASPRYGPAACDSYTYMKIRFAMSKIAPIVKSAQCWWFIRNVSHIPGIDLSDVFRKVKTHT